MAWGSLCQSPGLHKTPGRLGRFGPGVGVRPSRARPPALDQDPAPHHSEAGPAEQTAWEWPIHHQAGPGESHVCPFAEDWGLFAGAGSEMRSLFGRYESPPAPYAACPSPTAPFYLPPRALAARPLDCPDAPPGRTVSQAVGAWPRARAPRPVGRAGWCHGVLGSCCRHPPRDGGPGPRLPHPGCVDIAPEGLSCFGCGRWPLPAQGPLGAGSRQPMAPGHAGVGEPLPILGGPPPGDSGQHRLGVRVCLCPAPHIQNCLETQLRPQGRPAGRSQGTPLLSRAGSETPGQRGV